MDQMTEIIGIVRDAISDGLLKGETVDHFDDTVRSLRGPALEDYLQTLWDQV
jgi:hypothetical protein